MFKSSLRKEEKSPPLSIKDALQDLESDMIHMFEESYSYITKHPKAKIISGINTLFTFALWFILLDFYRYYNSVLGESTPFTNLYEMIPLPKENLYITAGLHFITTLLTVLFLGKALTFLFERIRVERHITNKTIDTYLKHNGSMKILLILLFGFFTGFIFYLVILEDMQFHQYILRDVIVYIFMLITIFVYRYNKLVLKFSNDMKNEVLNTYLEVIESTIEERKNEKND
ncbi:hypothetical protein [Lysinibacillus sphaericus]|uniref:Uncharacterized protein n=1 Tax=Lysinibacillus sphaericus TaxID=1421 RepID=A0A6H0A210_LYSSH|nr:hypothetical protein [Lysinibacillus sphaericus]QIS31276.1 hypothetical protein [Lysinibacillus sphaericus]QPA61342.1 hypothetical protein INQ55_23725 [Lysinibacillus sphaericus]